MQFPTQETVWRKIIVKTVNTLTFVQPLKKEILKIVQRFCKDCKEPNLRSWDIWKLLVITKNQKEEERRELFPLKCVIMTDELLLLLRVINLWSHSLIHVSFVEVWLSFFSRSHCSPEKSPKSKEQERRCTSICPIILAGVLSFYCSTVLFCSTVCSSWRRGCRGWNILSSNGVWHCFRFLSLVCGLWGTKNEIVVVGKKHYILSCLFVFHVGDRKTKVYKVRVYKVRMYKV